MHSGNNIHGVQAEESLKCGDFQKALGEGVEPGFLSAAGISMEVTASAYSLNSWKFLVPQGYQTVSASLSEWENSKPQGRISV